MHITCIYTCGNTDYHIGLYFSVCQKRRVPVASTPLAGLSRAQNARLATSALTTLLLQCSVWPGHLPVSRARPALPVPPAHPVPLPGCQPPLLVALGHISQTLDRTHVFPVPQVSVPCPPDECHLSPR